MTLGNYRIIRQLGSGGMGRVYEAEHMVIGREVAVKVLHESRAREHGMRQRFLAEARAHARIKHPHIVRVIDFGQEGDGRIYYVMELLEGKMLIDLLGRGNTFSVRQALVIAAQIAHALISVHEQNIVHRDVNAKNVHIGQRQPTHDFIPILHGAREIIRVEQESFGYATLTDFGIAKFPNILDDEGESFGTPLYAAPEQIRGERVDARTDIYGLGCLLYETIVGNTPFLVDTVQRATEMNLNDPPQRLCKVRPDLNIPEAVEQMILKALAKDCDQRQQTAQEFLDDLMVCWQSIT